MHTLINLQKPFIPPPRQIGRGPFWRVHCHSGIMGASPIKGDPTHPSHPHPAAKTARLQPPPQRQRYNQNEKRGMLHPARLAWQRSSNASVGTSATGSSDR